ncbi:MAG: DUF5677 domain-containing protein [Limisphaerales bacterium]
MQPQTGQCIFGIEEWKLRVALLMEEKHMDTPLETKAAYKLIKRFCSEANAELDERWKSWKIDHSQIELHEVVGALMARQVTLAICLTESPTLWNWDIAPLFLRPMTEVYLNLAWIFEKPLERSRAFIDYGLGQMKLRIEHLKSLPPQSDASMQKFIEESLKSMERWVNSQRYSCYVEVNLSKWAENQRKMADDVGEIDFYNHCYTPYSAGVHSMWHHVGSYNLRQCTNPLHKFHKVPQVPRLGADAHFLFLAGKYLNMVFDLFDEKIGTKCQSPSAFKNVCKGIRDASSADSTKDN